ncbi:MAG: chromosome segregation protein ScpA [Thermoplasmatales archaeon]|nr:chromosome segregation protein ScpA [Thermoplasmatales archaeon]
MNCETIERMKDHLTFHRALIDDNVGNERLDRYMGILLGQETERMPDPTDEAIRSIFSLVFENHLDPWEIDIREFVRLYNAKVRESRIDMIVAGKLMLMAWRILRMQTDRTLEESERDQAIYDDFLFNLDPDFFLPEEETLYVPHAEFSVAVRRDPVRPVTMLELLDAFDEAREEMAVYEERERVRQELRAREPRKFENKAHEEDDKKELEQVWEKIQKMGTGPMMLTDLFTGDVMENITVFVAALHLVRDGKINVWQTELPYGEIYVEIKTDWATGTVEDELSPAIREAVM